MKLPKKKSPHYSFRCYGHELGKKKNYHSPCNLDGLGTWIVI